MTPRPRLTVQPRADGSPMLSVKGITALSVHRQGLEVSFHNIPGALFDRIPGVSTGSLTDGTRTKVIRRGKRRLVFFSEPEVVRR